MPENVSHIIISRQICLLINGLPLSHIGKNMKEKITKNHLYQLFISYVEQTKLHFKSSVFNKRTDNIVYISRPYQIGTIVEQLEKSKEFSRLVSAFSVAFGGKPINKSDLSSIPRYRLKNFFRRSKLYINFFENNFDDVNVDDYFEHLWSVSNGRTIETTYFRLLEGVFFPESDIDLGIFKIQIFSKSELDKLVGNQLNQFFYPYAVLDTEELQYWWFIVKKSYKTYPKIDEWPEFMDESLLVSRTFPDRSIQQISLFEWENKSFASGDENDDMILGWLKFPDPWSFHISDDIFENPSHIQDLPNLPCSPNHDTQGNVVGTSPEFYFNLETNDLKNLKSIVGKAQVFFNSIDLKKCKWTFLSRAMDYLAKAFIEKDDLEELLWHITVLDILIGEKNGVKANIKRRLGIIFWKKNNKEIKCVRKIFEDLYDFRSELVQGKSPEKKGKLKKIYFGHLKSARTLARNTLIWFIDTLAFIHSELSRHSIPLEDYPQRDDLLYIFDFHIKYLKGKFNGSNFTKILVNMSEIKKNSNVESKMRG